MNFSNNLKYLRNIHNITQEELAHYLHVSRPTIAGYETKNKQPDYDKLIQIASFFKVSIDYLLTGCEFHDDIVSKPSHKAPAKINIDDCTKNNIIRIMNTMGKKDLRDLQDYAEYLVYKSNKHEDK